MRLDPFWFFRDPARVKLGIILGIIVLIMFGVLGAVVVLKK